MRLWVAIGAWVGGVGLAGMAGCAGTSAGARPETSGPRVEDSQQAPPFQPLGNAPIPGTVAPEDYVVVGWTFAAGDALRGDLPLEAALTDASPTVRRDLQAILTRLEEARSTIAPGAPVGLEAPKLESPRRPEERRYRLAVARRWILDLALLEVFGDTSRAHVTARVDDRELDFTAEAPDLLKYLRGLAFESLVDAMTRPRIPSAWHPAALASFLALSPITAEPPLPTDRSERARLRADILSFLDRSSDDTELARALVSHVRIFEPQEVDRFARVTSLPIRLVSLTRSAASGNRPALDEILTTSLEYFGEELLFAAALEVLFPRDLNGELYALYPEEGTSPTVSLAFIQEIRAGVSKATFRSGEGWVL